MEGKRASFIGPVRQTPRTTRYLNTLGCRSRLLLLLLLVLLLVLLAWLTLFASDYFGFCSR